MGRGGNEKMPRKWRKITRRRIMGAFRVRGDLSSNYIRLTPGSVDDVIERVLDDSFRTERLEPGNDLPDDFLVDDGLDGDPAGEGEVSDSRIPQGRERLQHFIQPVLLEVHLQADFVAS